MVSIGDELPYCHSCAGGYPENGKMKIYPIFLYFYPEHPVYPVKKMEIPILSK
jgi:hypothetical protein